MSDRRPCRSRSRSGMVAFSADADTHDLVALGQLDGAHAVAAAAMGRASLLIEAGWRPLRVATMSISWPEVSLVQASAATSFRAISSADCGYWRTAQQGIALDEALLCDHGHGKPPSLAVSFSVRSMLTTPRLGPACGRFTMLVPLLVRLPQTWCPLMRNRRPYR